MKAIQDWLMMLRAHQWIKNIFLFMPLIFSGNFFEPLSLTRVVSAFLCFCLVSSAFYIVNDIFDRREDMRHPHKRLRPIASGRISLVMAWSLALIFFFCGVSAAYVIDDYFLAVVLIYSVTQVMYNWFVKRVVLWDVVFLSFGFLLRVWAGAAAASVKLSFWLFICVFALALFLGFAKRRHELSLLQKDAIDQRDVLKHYSLYFLDQTILLCAALAIVFYSLYTISPEQVLRGGYAMVLSVIFVIYGMLRYLYLIHMEKMGGDPSQLAVKDKPLLLTVSCWVGYLFFVLYIFSKKSF